MFKEFELPFVPTVVLSVVLSVVAIAFISAPRTPADAMNNLASWDAELQGTELIVHREITVQDMRYLLDLADIVWRSRDDYDTSVGLSVRLEHP
jgi:membrane protein implicated in regulation of membrane protease activity